MTDEFNRQIWELAKTSPDLQEALLNGKLKGKEREPYWLPKTDLRDAVFNLDEEARDKWLQVMKKAYNEMTLKQIALMQGELKPALEIAEIKGEELSEIEKTLKDVNIFTLAILLLIEWQKHITHADKPAEQQGYQNEEQKVDQHLKYTIKTEQTEKKEG
jgi:hypothetical protein